MLVAGAAARGVLVAGAAARGVLVAGAAARGVLVPVAGAAARGVPGVAAAMRGVLTACRAEGPAEVPAAAAPPLPPSPPPPLLLPPMPMPLLPLPLLMLLLPPPPLPPPLLPLWLPRGVRIAGAAVATPKLPVARGLRRGPPLEFAPWRDARLAWRADPGAAVEPRAECEVTESAEALARGVRGAEPPRALPRGFWLSRGVREPAITSAPVDSQRCVPSALTAWD